jgi:hypothetical protein
MMETTFDKFINNDPDEKKLFEKEYADFAVSEFALEKMDEEEYDALDEYYTKNTVMPIGKPGFFASRKAAEQRKAPISHWTGNTVKVLETAYPESSFGLFSVVKDSASIEPEETDPNYTAQKNNRGKITEGLCLLETIQRQAARGALNAMSLDEINNEINAYRKEKWD